MLNVRPDALGVCRTGTLACLLLAILSVSASTGAAIVVDISFDDGTDLAVIGSVYSAQGVTFSNAKWYDWVTRGRDDPGATPDFMIGGEDPVAGYPVGIFPDIDDPIAAAFSAPASVATITAISCGGAGARLEALDDQGGVLDFEEAYGTGNGAGEFFILTVDTTPDFLIHSVRFYQPLDGPSHGDGLFWDNFSATVPEPATLSLLAVGVLVVVRHKHRR